MIYGIAIYASYGVRVKRAYVCDHEGDGFMPLHEGLEAQYVTGHQPARYPMPAIRERSNAEWFWVAFKDYHDGNISEYGLNVMLASVLFCNHVDVV